jgi:SanA protein
VLGKILRVFIRLVLYLFLAAVVIFGLARVITWVYSAGKMYTVNEAPQSRVAVVFGAGLQRDGTPSVILRDRVKTAADLYFAGKVEKILMSGDNRFIYYNEPGSMAEYAIGLGVPAEDIVLDYAGRRTYDTCYRARHIFGVDQPILVTQRFHLYRTVFTCNMLGEKAVGVPADQRQYNPIWSLREIPASLVALWEVWFSHPLPVLGEKEPIFPSEAQPIPDSSPTPSTNSLSEEG